MPNAATSTAPLPPLQPAQTAQATVAAARTYLEKGQVTQAARALEQLEQAATPAHNAHLQFAAMSTLGEICVKQGKLHLAAATYQFLLDWVDVQPRDAELFRFYAGLCALYYEWNHLAKAEQYLHWSLTTIAENCLPTRWAVAGQVRLAWVCWAQGNFNAAQAALHQAQVAAQSAADQPALRRVAAEQATFWLRQGQLAPALHWAEECGLDPNGHVNYQRHVEYLTLARVWIANGQAARAAPLLQQLRRAATADGRNGDLIEILVLRALALAAQGDAQHAWTELAQALCRAEREEYLRTFVDEGQPLVALLQQTAVKGVTLIYIKNLLATFASSPPTLSAPLIAQPQPAMALVEPLTLREREVLRLVAAGNANDEIAQALSISSTTVKKHLGNVFGKLNAKNRTEAVAKARAIELL